MTSAEGKGQGRVYSIPPAAPFVDALARGLLSRAGEAPLALSAVTVLLPTRRACRALQEAFLRCVAGRPLLLPRMLPLGDLDEEELLLAADEMPAEGGAALALPPAIAPLRRQLLLARLVRHWGARSGQAIPGDQAVRLAAELARLIDQTETEGLDFAGLDRLVPEDYAEHWQRTLRFLRIVTEHWPALQADEGCIGPAARRAALAQEQARQWQAAPPAGAIVAAGSTGSIPATAALLKAVAALPQGMVVLPGLDREADAETWDAILADPAHPQHGLALLLRRLELPREAVLPWPGTEAALPARARLVDVALRPAAATADWPELIAGLDRGAAAAALAGLHRIDCPDPGEEAKVIALVLRRALETPGRRAALVTPDRSLARRVAAELMRWGVAVDDSAGVPLGETPPGAFLRQSAEMLAGALAPLPLLAALKHPLAAGGQAPGAFRARVRALEMAALRGPRPAAGFAGLRRALGRGAKVKPLRDWLRRLETAAAPALRALKRGGPLRTLVDAHLRFAEWLAASDGETGAARLWAGEAGSAAADFVAELRTAAGDETVVAGAGYPALLGALMAGHAVRPRYGRHPRLAILGPLEARLQQADVVVLGGLNEGTWPGEVDPGPWLSRPMRRDFGLPPPERRVGLAAHDFAQALQAPEVHLTRATRVEGAPSVPSRWLLRLDAVLQALGLPAALDDLAAPWLAWAAALDRPQAAAPQGPPAPTPPLAARPRRLSVTRVETWMRDPYDLYAEKILGLQALDALDADPGAADFGTLVHAALESYLRAHPERLPADPEAALLAAGRRAFDEAAAPPAVWAFWWPRYRRLAAWMAERERAGRPAVHRAFAEVKGRLTIAAPGGDFELTATADRIDRLVDGRLVVLDYKTGGVPGKKEIELGFAPQLPLEAAIAAAGGFEGPGAAAVARLEYWKVNGAEPPGFVATLDLDPEAAGAAALDGLARRVARFDDPATPYAAKPWPKYARRYSDYRHLAREKEWSSDDGAGDDS